MWIDISFSNGSNPYICFTNEKFFEFVKNYSLEMVGTSSFIAHECQFLTIKKTVSSYEKAKTALRDFAVEFSNKQGDFSMSWGDRCEWSAFFETYGKKYGLLREFRENAIC